MSRELFGFLGVVRAATRERQIRSRPGRGEGGAVRANAALRISAGCDGVE